MWNACERDQQILGAFRQILCAVGLDSNDPVSHQVLSALRVLAACLDAEEKFIRAVAAKGQNGTKL